MKLKLASRNSRKSSTTKKYEQGLSECFLRSYCDFKKFAVIQSVFRRVFLYEILFLVIKFVLNKINLTWHYTKLYYFLLRFWINKVGCWFHCSTDILPCSVMPSVIGAYGWSHFSIQLKWSHFSVQLKNHHRSSPWTFFS